MSRTRPAPHAGESPFGIDELFYSTTDPKGRILSGNAVFTRTSKYPLDEVLGQPHNIIRHPEMPRAVFRLLWEFIGSGRPIAAYVKNLAKDGSFYWVMATVVPHETGYLSIRLKPSSPLFARVQEIYKELLALEHQVEGGDSKLRDRAMDAAQARLLEILASAGFASYEAFMHAALPAEVTSRAAQLGVGGRGVAAGGRGVAADARAGADAALLGVVASCAGMQEFLDGLVSNIEQYSALNKTLASKSSFVLHLAESIRLFSLNALLESSRLGASGAALAAVASLLRSRSDAVSPVIRSLSEEITDLVGLLGDLSFRIAVSKLQTEGGMVFVGELLERIHDGHNVVHDLAVLADCIGDSVNRLFSSLDAVDRRLTTLLRHVRQLESGLDTIRALEVNGRIEAATVLHQGSLMALFRTIGENVRAARGEIRDFQHVGRIADGRDAASEARVPHLADFEGHVAALLSA
jgi:aerotaxis receptor